MNLTKDNVEEFYENACNALNFCNSVKDSLSASAQGVIDSLGSLSVNTGSEDIIVSAFGKYLSPDGFICGTCQDVVNSVNGGSMEYLTSTLDSLISSLAEYEYALNCYDSAVAHNNSVNDKLNGQSLSEYNSEHPNSKLKYENVGYLLTEINSKKSKCDGLLNVLSGITFSSNRSADEAAAAAAAAEAAAAGAASGGDTSADPYQGTYYSEDGGEVSIYKREDGTYDVYVLENGVGTWYENQSESDVKNLVDALTDNGFSKSDKETYFENGLYIQEETELADSNNGEDSEEGEDKGEEKTSEEETPAEENTPTEEEVPAEEQPAEEKKVPEEIVEDVDLDADVDANPAEEKGDGDNSGDDKSGRTEYVSDNGHTMTTIDNGDGTYEVFFDGESQGNMTAEEVQRILNASTYQEYDGDPSNKPTPENILINPVETESPSDEQSEQQAEQPSEQPADNKLEQNAAQQQSNPPLTAESLEGYYDASYEDSFGPHNEKIYVWQDPVTGDFKCSGETYNDVNISAWLMEQNNNYDEQPSLEQVQEFIQNYYHGQYVGKDL